MHFSYLVAAAFMVCSTQAQTPPKGAAPASVPGPQTPPAGSATGANGPQPKMIHMDCTQAYMPFSEADVAAMSSNSTQAATDGKYSSIPTEAACKGPQGTPDALCRISSCGNHPVCNDCVELLFNDPNKPSKGKETKPQVTCTNNYFFGNATDPIKNVCTDGNDKPWTCSGVCTSFTSCESCISVDDPALQSLQAS